MSHSNTNNGRRNRGQRNNGRALTGRDVPPGLICRKAIRIQNDDIGFDAKIILAILRWFEQHGQAQVAQEELEIAFNIVHEYAAGQRAALGALVIMSGAGAA